MKIDLLKMTILFTFLFLATFNSIHSQSNIEIKSPNEKIKVEFSLLLSSQPFYKVVYDSIIIIDNSALGFVFKDQPIMLDNFKVTNTNRKYFLGKWETIWGTQDSILDEYNELIISLEEKDDLARKMNIIFKVYDDGIGFRYEFPDQLNMNDIVIMDELTEFRLTGDHSCWWIPGDYDSYEYLYNNSKLSEIDLTPLIMKQEVIEIYPIKEQ